jgi:hypothetical protein
MIRLSFAIPAIHADEANSVLAGLGMGPCFSIPLLDSNNQAYLAGHSLGNGTEDLIAALPGFMKQHPIFLNMIFSETDFETFLADTGLSRVPSPVDLRRAVL